jgi:nucleotide-binding universal stress UspA family protein
MYALRTAYTLAREHGARLIVLHVLEPGEEGGDPAAARRRLGRFPSSYPVICVERQVRSGEPAAEILGAAAESRCNLIVMGAHGRSGRGRGALGRKAEEVLRRAPCPVVIVQAPPDAGRLERSR